MWQKFLILVYTVQNTRSVGRVANYISGWGSWKLAIVHCFLKIKMLQSSLKFPCRFKLLVNCFYNWCPLGHREGGQGGQWPRGPWTLRVPSESPSKWHWQISLWKVEDLFFFWGHIKIRRKLWHSPLPFWSTQNHRCLIFKLTPGPRLCSSKLYG